MLDNLARYIPAVSLASLAAVSIFNIGYFYVIGFHFVGVMDLSNIVYSVGLVFVFLFIAVQIVAFIMAAPTIKDPEDTDRGSVWIVISGIALVLPLGIWKLINNEIEITPLDISVLAIGVFAFWWWWYVGQQLSELRPFRILAALSMSVTALFVLGGFIATRQAHYANRLYDVSTKAGNFHRVRLVRSSSSGFIVTQDRSFIFIPSSEIKLISALKPSR